MPTRFESIAALFTADKDDYLYSAYYEDDYSIPFQRRAPVACVPPAHELIDWGHAPPRAPCPLPVARGPLPDVHDMRVGAAVTADPPTLARHWKECCMVGDMAEVAFTRVAESLGWAQRFIQNAVVMDMRKHVDILLQAPLGDDIGEDGWVPAVGSGGRDRGRVSDNDSGVNDSIRGDSDDDGDGNGDEEGGVDGGNSRACASPPLTHVVPIVGSVRTRARGDTCDAHANAPSARRARRHSGGDATSSSWPLTSAGEGESAATFGYGFRSPCRELWVDVKAPRRLSRTDKESQTHFIFLELHETGSLHNSKAHVLAFQVARFTFVLLDRARLWTWVTQRVAPGVAPLVPTAPQALYAVYCRPRKYGTGCTLVTLVPLVDAYAAAGCGVWCNLEWERASTPHTDDDATGAPAAAPHVAVPSELLPPPLQLPL